MAEKAGGYYGAAFKGARGVTQGYPLPPTIFNVVVDVVVRHWVTVMVESAEEWGRRGKEGIHQNSLFYADDDMVASSDPQWLQEAFSTLSGLFYRVGLNTNVGKTFRMVYRPCQEAGMQLEAVCRIRMTGSGPSYWESQWGRIQCKECG